MGFTGLSHRDWASARHRVQVAIAAAVMAVGLLALQAGAARESQTEAPVALAGLPAEAQTTYRAILGGGPFRHAKDGIVFGNRERLLPRKARGYYR